MKANILTEPYLTSILCVCEQQWPLARLYGCSVSSENLMVAPVIHTKYVCVDIYMYFSSHARTGTENKNFMFNSAGLEIYSAHKC